VQPSVFVPPSKGFWKSNIQNSRGGSQKSEFAQAKTSGPSLPTYDYPSHFPPPKSKVPPPVNRMPVEILGDIFTQFLQMGDFVTEPYAFSLSVSPDWVASPMVLGQVCGYWRSIALSMPSLWCSISVSSPVRGVVPRIQTWLERAGQHPLKLFVEQSIRPDAAEEAVTDEIFALLLQHYHHWEHITFKVYGRMIESLANIQDTPAPLLTSALLDLWWNEAVVDRIWSVLHSSPKLSHINWNDVYSHVRDLPTHIPWNQLEDVALSHYFDINGFCTFLEQCSRLERLQVSWIDRLGASPGPCAPIFLTHLRHLSICARTSLDPVFSRLVAPALTSMSLNYDLPMKEYRGASEFGDLLRRSSCTLKFFKIYDPEGVDFLNFLRHSHRQLNSLEDLHVRTTIPHELIAALTLNSTNKFQLLPRLKKLKLAGCSSPEGITKMISSRLSPHIKYPEMEALTSAWVEINGDALPSELDTFRRVKRGGVKIELCCSGD
jgi:hypothetical protein